MGTPSSLLRDISPPPLSKRRKTYRPGVDEPLRDHIVPSLAAVEAGKAKIDDHLAYFKEHLSKASRDTKDVVRRIPINRFTSLFQENEHVHGNHFVIHQHNHPKAGVHYDLRLQFSQSSSISFAVPKGLPGNPNSKSIGRMAIETRVHNLWNHLIESASPKTGSLLIWDTGTYTVLPRAIAMKNTSSLQTTDDESEESYAESIAIEAQIAQDTAEHENEKLIEAFQTRYIRLRLHGTRLPKNYTVILRLPSANNISKRPIIRRKSRTASKYQAQTQPYFTDSDPDADNPDSDTPDQQPQDQAEDNLDTDSEEDLQTRLNNAYPGSTNSIGSVHQRRWFMQLDRANSGFVLQKDGPGKGNWIRGDDGSGFEPFFVKGRDFERSIVTGRLANEVESDEGVEGFRGRAGWVGVEH